MHYTDHLESPRLITRFVTQDDVTPWLEYCNDPEAIRFTGVPGMVGMDFAQYWIDRTIGRYADNHGVQALISKETGELLGMSGLVMQQVNNAWEMEIGYHLLPKHWGKGYATEAAMLFRDYGFERNDVPSIVSIIHPLNIASQKVALRNGMHLVDTNANFKNDIYYLYRITREQWEAPAANK